MKNLKHVLNPTTWHMGVWAAICLVGFVMSSYAWVVSSPTGNSPDDGFHQASIWCPTPVNESCTVVDYNDLPSVLIPQSAYYTECYNHYGNKSAACILHLSDNLLVPAARYDDGTYPGYYYDIMHTLVEKDVDRTILVIRWVNVSMAALLYGAIFFLASPSGRRLVAYTLLGTAVPLVTFFSASINPTSWGIMGVVSAWLALHLGLTSTSKPRRLALFGLAVIGAAVAAAARSDSGAYLVVICCVILVYHWPNLIHRLRLVIPLAVVSLLGVISNLSGAQGAVVTEGMSRPAEIIGDPIRVLAYNILETPDFFTSFWFFSMGSLDAPVPMITGTLAAAVTIGLCWWGASRAKMNIRHILCLIGLAVAIVGLPIATLQVTLTYYPNVIQARYLAPLIIVFVGVCLADRIKDAAPLSRTATLWFLVLISVANAYALRTLIQRYTTGLIGSHAINLNIGVQWWRGGGPSPMGTWIMGSIGFALMSTILFAVRMRPSAPKEVLDQVDVPDKV